MIMIKELSYCVKIGNYNLTSNIFKINDNNLTNDC